MIETVLLDYWKDGIVCPLADIRAHQGSLIGLVVSTEVVKGGDSEERFLDSLI